MKIGVEVAHTLNTGNYGTVRPGMYVEDDVLEGETEKQTYQRVSKIAHQFWATEFRTQLSEHAAARKVIEKSLGD
jgi:hypothetical protein